MTDLKDALAFAGQGGLATRFTRIGPEEAAALCQKTYGISGAMKRLETEKDDTYLISAPDARYILKIANPDEAQAELELQNAVLDHLAVHFARPAPRLIRAISGEGMLREPASGRFYRLLSFVEGTPLDMMDARPETLPEIGRVLGELRLALSGFTHPAQNRELVWDVQHVMRLRPLLAEVDLPPDHHALAGQAFARLAEVAHRIPALERQVVHNDFYASNIVADPETGRLTGVIDFGDVVESAVAIDLAVAMMGQILTDFTPDQDIFAPAYPVLAGYLEVAPIAKTDLAMVPHMVMARVLVRAVMTQYRAALMPENAPYILRKAAPSWAQLQWFLARPTAEVEDILRAPLRSFS
ncbi:phosphotransferase [Thioclava sp. GXIMD4216]|uniref:phosphotransferase n=1 Tax=Thioclava sp. GXIMD4216 TaxID=3131929 RepID=UPI0030CB3CDD